MKLIQTVFALTAILLIGQVMPANAQSLNANAQSLNANAQSLNANAQSLNDCAAQARTSSDSFTQLTELGRALNLARQTGEATNGGLGKYRPEVSMYGPADEAACTVSGDDMWTFTFKGTAPGSSVPMVETAVTINHKTWQITLDHNTRLY